MDDDLNSLRGSDSSPLGGGDSSPLGGGEDDLLGGFGEPTTVSQSAAPTTVSKAATPPVPRKKPAPAKRSGGSSVGLTPQQRMLLSVFLFMDVAVLGCLVLIALGVIQV